MATLAHEAKSPQPDFRSGTIDLARVKREINIELVARLLGFEINAQHYTSCFRPDNHRNGDANPSLHFLPRKNCATCFRCDRRAMNNINFVMAVFQSRNQPCQFRDAIRWFRNEFNLPVLKGRPGGLTRDKPYRVGVASILEDLHRSGLYATLSEKAVRVLDAIERFRDDRNRARLPYQTLMRYTGIGSKSTIKAAVDELGDIHLVAVQKGHAGSIEPHNIYILTPNDPQFVQLIQQTYEQNREGVAAQIDYYQEQKLTRRRVPKPVTELSQPQD